MQLRFIVIFSENVLVAFFAEETFVAMNPATA